MKNISKFCLVLAAIFSMTTCSKGKKCSKEDFAEEAKTIKTRNENLKANISYSYLEERTNDKSKNKEQEGSGEFTYDAKEHTWSDGDAYENNRILFSFSLDFLCNQLFNTDFDKLKDSDENRKINYFVKPFGYEETVNVTYEILNDGYFGYGIDDCINDLTKPTVIKGTAYVYCEWDEYGYLTKFVNKIDAKIHVSEDLEDYFKLRETYEISYVCTD